MGCQTRNFSAWNVDNDPHPFRVRGFLDNTTRSVNACQDITAVEWDTELKVPV